jgi:hypothetical protein
MTFHFEGGPWLYAGAKRLLRGTGAHEAVERPHAPLQTGLLAYASHMLDVKEWYYYPAADPQAPDQAGPRAGPLSKDEIKRAFSKHEVCHCESGGMSLPVPWL